jgi:undecaprenyl diphosphate synthase
MSNRELIIPANVALIPDGNRRWAKSNKMNLFNGYNYGIKKFVKFSLWLKGFGSKSLTVWALSTENIQKRTSQELGILYKLYVRAAYDKEILKMLDDTQARVKIIGNRKLIPKAVNKALSYVERYTAKYDKFYINVLLAYGGHDDILYAAKKLLSEGVNPRSISEDALKRNLRTAKVSDPDLIIRTSGEERLSGLLPWQSSYSELYFSKKYWPDFGKADLSDAISEFSRRKRRYGK